MKLFHKILLFSVLAQVAAVILVGISMELFRPSLPPPMPPMMGLGFPPPPPPPHSFFGWLLGPAFIPLLIGLLVGVIAALSLSWWMSRPILKLHYGMQQISQGDLSYRLFPQFASRHDELSDLAQAYDEMAQYVQTMLSEQQALLHDISHEIRSPITRIQLRLASLDKENETIKLAIDRDLERLNQLVEESLFRARVLTQHQRPNFWPVDVSEIVRNVLDDVRVEADSRPCHLMLEGDVSQFILGDDVLLHRALENIIRNAIKFSPIDGVVRIILSDSSDLGLIIQVIDQGVGIPNPLIFDVFKPFVRVSTGRINNGGLGLSIVKRIIELHGGALSAQNQEPNGLCVRIYLPLANENNMS
jgi:signal transduction histidine kinase